MGLTIDMPKTPSFAKNGIIISVNTTITNVQTHYIILSVYVNSKKYELKHPVINKVAKFDIGKIIETNISKIFNLQENIVSDCPITISWSVRASETYNNTHERNKTNFHYSYSYPGHADNFIKKIFLSNYNNRIINKDDFILLYLNTEEIKRRPSKLLIKFDDPDETKLIIPFVPNNNTIQVLIKPNLIPKNTNKIRIEVISYSETFKINIKNIQNIDKQIILFRNSFGVYDTISFLAHTKIEEKYAFDTIETKTELKKINTSVIQKTEKATLLLFNQFYDEKETSIRLKELFLSEEVYLVNNNYDVEPILINTKKRTIVNTLEETYTLEISYTKKINNVRN